MKFRVEDIPPEGRNEKFLRDPSWMDERLSGERVPLFKFASPITVTLTLSRSGQVVLLRSRIEAMVEWLCARCLEPFSRPLASEYAITLKPKPSLPMPEEVELRREDVETEFYEGEEINVAPLVQDQVLLALPQKAVCREDCRGLCPKCGKNLNQEGCRCPEESIDPRLAVLKKFRFH